MSTKKTHKTQIPRAFRRATDGGSSIVNSSMAVNNNNLQSNLINGTPQIWQTAAEWKRTKPRKIDYEDGSWCTASNIMECQSLSFDDRTHSTSSIKSELATPITPTSDANKLVLNGWGHNDAHIWSDSPKKTAGSFWLYRNCDDISSTDWEKSFSDQRSGCITLPYFEEDIKDQTNAPHIQAGTDNKAIPAHLQVDIKDQSISPHLQVIKNQEIPPHLQVPGNQNAELHNTSAHLKIINDQEKPPHLQIPNQKEADLDIVTVPRLKNIDTGDHEANLDITQPHLQIVNQVAESKAMPLQHQVIKNQDSLQPSVEKVNHEQKREPKIDRHPEITHYREAFADLTRFINDQQSISTNSKSIDDEDTIPPHLKIAGDIDKIFPQLSPVKTQETGLDVAPHLQKPITKAGLETAPPHAQKVETDSQKANSDILPPHLQKADIRHQEAGLEPTSPHLQVVNDHENTPPNLKTIDNQDEIPPHLRIVADQNETPPHLRPVKKREAGSHISTPRPFEKINTREQETALLESASPHLQPVNVQKTELDITPPHLQVINNEDIISAGETSSVAIALLPASVTAHGPGSLPSSPEENTDAAQSPLSDHSGSTNNRRNNQRRNNQNKDNRRYNNGFQNNAGGRNREVADRPKRMSPWKEAKLWWEPASEQEQWGANTIGTEKHSTVPTIYEDQLNLLSPEKKAKQLMEIALHEWPWVRAPQKSVTLAPFTLNDALSKGNSMPSKQTSPFFMKIWNNSHVRKMIVDIIFEDHSTAWKFASTCRQAWTLLREDIHIWNITDGHFNSCEVPRSELNMSITKQASVSSVVVVTPIRGKDSSINYEKQVQNLRNMCLSMSNFSQFFRNIQLHRVPFLTPGVLKLTIPKMKNLHTLGVYKCSLINIGDTLKLLEIVRRDRSPDGDSQVSLDFYPNFHVGPECNSNRRNQTGSYGVSWDNFGSRSDLAIWQLVSVILPLARQQGVDFVSPHTAFRKWLDDSPCWRVEETLAKMQDPKTHDAELVSLFNYRELEGRWDLVYGSEKWAWAYCRARCLRCGANNLGIFYDYVSCYPELSQISQNPNAQHTAPMHCLGCILDGYLYNESDHYKAIKREVIAEWLKTEEDSPSLDYLVKRPSHRTNEALRRLMMQRNHDMKALWPPRDHESDEVQRPAPKSWFTHKAGPKNKSPEIGEEIIRERKDPVWDALCHTRYEYGGYRF